MSWILYDMQNQDSAKNKMIKMARFFEKEFETHNGYAQIAPKPKVIDLDAMSRKSFLTEEEKWQIELCRGVFNMPIRNLGMSGEDIFFDMDEKCTDEQGKSVPKGYFHKAERMCS